MYDDDDDNDDDNDGDDDVTQPTFASSLWVYIGVYVCLLQPPRYTIQCVITMTQTDVLYLCTVCVCVCPEVSPQAGTDLLC